MENRESKVKRPGVGFFLSDLGKSIRRRRRQMFLLGVISFLSAFFLLGMYLFQENSGNYQFAAHQVAYGDWCIAEIVERGSAAAQDAGADADEEVASQTVNVDADEGAASQKVNVDVDEEEVSQDDDGDSASTQYFSLDTSVAPTASFGSHAYFNQIGYMESGVSVYDSEGNLYDVQVGYMDEMLLELGSVFVYYGRLPETDTEIAITMDAGAELGSSYVIGETEITFYTISDERTADGELIYESHSYTIVGILQGTCQQWATGEWMPDALVTQTALEEITGAGGAPIAGWFYQLKDEFGDVNVTELYENMNATLNVSDTEESSEDGDSAKSDVEDSDTEPEEITASDAGTITLYVNDLLYSDSSTDSAIYYLLLKLLISATSAIALSFLLISYIQKRRPEYYRFRTIGMSRKRVYLMMWVEALSASVPSLIAGLVFAAVVGRVVVAVVCARGEYVFEYEISVGLAASALLVWIVTFVLAMMLAMASNRDSSLQGNIRTLTISDKVKHHRNRMRPKHFLLGMDIRIRKVHCGTSIFSCLLGMIFLGLFLFGGIRILEDYLSYASILDYMGDFDVFCDGESQTKVDSDDENSRLSDSYPDDEYITITDESGTISYESNYEALQQARSEFMQTLRIYGAFMIFLLAFYLMLKLDMIQTEVSRQSDRIRLLRCMGIEKKRLGHMYALDGLLESGLLWLPPIVVWVVQYVLVKNDILDVDEYQSLWKIYLPFAIVSVVGMTLLHVGARYTTIKVHEARAEGER
ncbi:MAG: FtsX-like permease family protein [Clostridiales bacterium]|nr:FtsX-like permease family protein [Clostridiales bacterium]